jgi:isopentenyl diphosphate isomerase/L-lactate dehydrogenase-like FMN-dependent dehydrogenase
MARPTSRVSRGSHLLSDRFRDGGLDSAAVVQACRDRAGGIAPPAAHGGVRDGSSQRSA